MIDFERLSKESRINISLSCALQSALCGEIYPQMRCVCGYIDHISRKYLLLVVCDSDIATDVKESIFVVLADSLDGIPEGYEAKYFMTVVEDQVPYEVLADGWFCCEAFCRHENVNYVDSNVITIDLAESWREGY